MIPMHYLGCAQSIRRGSVALFGAGLLALTLGMSPAVDGREYYRWTDENGVQHFTDKPPRGANAERVRSGQRPTPTLLEDQEAQARKAEEEAAKKAAEEQAAQTPRAQQDAERCRIERERLATLQSNRQIRMPDDEGNLRDLSPEDIEAEVAYTQRAINQFCL